MRTLRVDDRPTRPAHAVAELGRIDTTIHDLTYVDDESKRQRTLTQLSRTEERHKLARAVFQGKHGELRQRYRERQEDQLRALELVVNIIMLWNTIYIDAAVEQLRTEEFPIKAEDLARLITHVETTTGLIAEMRMLRMDQVHVIMYKVLSEGVSVQQVARNHSSNKAL